MDSTVVSGRCEFDRCRATGIWFATQRRFREARLTLAVKFADKLLRFPAALVLILVLALTLRRRFLDLHCTAVNVRLGEWAGYFAVLRFGHGAESYSRAFLTCLDGTDTLKI